MNRLTKGTLAALAAMSIAIVGCEQGDDLESLDTLPSEDLTAPTESADDMSPTDEASPGES